MAIDEATLRELEKLTSEATQGPWEPVTHIHGGSSVYGNDDNPLAVMKQGIVEQHGNAAFIATSRTALPALLAAYREQAAEIERLGKERDEWRRHSDEAIDVRHHVETEGRANLALRERQLVEAEAERDAARAQLAEREAEVERLRGNEQSWVDICCHYRNLAIHLGAKPDDMMTQYDRGVCERGLHDGTDGERTIADERADAAETWRDLERSRAQLAATRAALGEAADVLRDIASNFDCDTDAHRYGTRCRACIAGAAYSRAAAPLDRDGKEE